MSAAASNAAAFYRDVAASQRVWTVRDAGGYPTATNSSGRRAQPFWSSKSRADRIVAKVTAYKQFDVVEIEWSAFVERWVPRLTNDQIDVGVNWSGPNAAGYDVAPVDVVRNVDHYVEKLA